MSHSRAGLVVVGLAISSFWLLLELRGTSTAGERRRLAVRPEGALDGASSALPGPIALPSGLGTPTAALVPQQALGGKQQPLQLQQLEEEGHEEYNSEDQEHQMVHERGGEPHGHGHGAEHVSKLARVIACFLLGFLFVDIMLLELVHYDDPNVRSYMYTMICATMSIFCAVLLNQAAVSFITEQILEGQPPRGFGIEVTLKGNVAIGGFLFLSAFATLNILCYKLRRTAQYLTAVEDIGAHITAFAGIHCFGSWQKIDAEKLGQPFCTCIVVVLAFGLCCALAARIRRRFTLEARREGDWNRKVQRDPGAFADGSEDDEVRAQRELEEELQCERRWLRAVEKAENEAAAILLSFVAHQAITWSITGQLPHLHGSAGYWDHEMTHIRRLSYTSLVLLLLIVLTTVINERREKLEGKVSGDRAKGSGTKPIRTSSMAATNPLERLTELWETFLAMTMSWTFMRVAYWLMRKVFHDQHAAMAAAALAVTVVAVVSIILLDMMADRIEVKRRLKDAKAPDQLMALRQTSSALSQMQLQAQTPSVLPSKPLAPLSSTTRRPRSEGPGQGQGQGPDSGPLGPLTAAASEDESASESSSEESSSSSSPSRQGGGASALLPRLSVGRSGKTFSVRGSMQNWLSDEWLPQDWLLPEDDSSLEKALRAIIVGFSLLVGLCWEQAFNAAEEAMVDGFGITKDHKVISKIIIAVVNVLLVIPAWLRFMVPMAKMHFREHQAMMDLEKLQAASNMPGTEGIMANFASAAQKLPPEDMAAALKFALQDRPGCATLVASVLQRAVEEEETLRKSR